MKKIVPVMLAGAMLALSFAACSSTVADISTSDGGEVQVDKSTAASVETDISTSAGEATLETEDDALTITYTDPDGYTKTVDDGDVVTYTLDGMELGRIVFVPQAVQADVIAQFNDMLSADAEQLKAYAEQFAADLDTDFTATPTTVAGYDALLIEGTIDDTATENPGAEAMVLVVPIGDRLVTVSAVADTATAEQVKADAKAFAGSLQDSGMAAAYGASSTEMDATASATSEKSTAT